MRPLRYTLALLAFFAAVSTAAKADTLDFTVTITGQNGITAVPIGTVYTGSAHYAGTFNLNSGLTVYPPTIDAFSFSYPPAPSTLTDYFTMATQRHVVGGPLFLLVSYLNPAIPNASFDIIGSGFALFNPNSITANGYSYSQNESGTVTYTVVPDPVATTPEPASLALLGTGLVGAFNLVRRESLTR